MHRMGVMLLINICEIGIYISLYIIQIYSGITSVRVFDGEVLYTEILEVNLFAFAYRLFHEDFSS